MNQKKIGAFLKELRKEKGLTQEQLSEQLGITNRTVSRWENGINMPDFDLVIELADIYDINIEELLDGERKTDMIDKEKEEALLKVADYESTEKMNFLKKLNFLFIIAVIAFIAYAILESNGLTATGIYEHIAEFCLGLVFGMLVIGVIFTSKYASKIRTFKRRLLKRNN